MINHSPDSHDSNNDFDGLSQPFNRHSDVFSIAPQTSAAMGALDIDSRNSARLRELLDKERHGVSCRTILVALGGHSWVLDEPIGPDSETLTRKIIQLNETLAERYNALAASEGLLDTLLASLPLMPRELSTRSYLRSIRDINHLVSEMKDAGLVTTHVETLHFSGGSARHGVLLFASKTLYKLSLTDLGRSILAD